MARSMARRAMAGCRATALVLLALAAGPAQAAPAVTAEDQAATDRMAEGHAHDAPVPTPAATTPPAAPVAAAPVTYGTVDGRPLQGYLARPAGVTGPLPGLIVIHEWWGLNDNIRAETRRLAAEGFVALAVDLYDGQQASAPPAAMKLSQALTNNPGPALANLRAAYDYLEQVEKAPRIGTIGWCLGGRWSLRTALLLPDQVDATVIYYGSVKADPAELATLQMPILGLFGAKDPIVPLASVEAFAAEMKKLGKPVDIQVYPGANHAFANPSGTAYDAPAAEDAWRRAIAFLRAQLARP